MEKILFVNACVRPESRTLILAKCLLACLGNDYTEVNVTDGNIKPLDFKALNERAEKIRRADFSDALFAPARQFAEADTVVIAAPFWDLSFPSCMKIYLENILVSGLTFTYRSGRPEGLCRTKRLYYVTTAGGTVTPDFGFNYVKALAETFCGIPEVKCFRAEGLDIIGNDARHILQEAKETIRYEMRSRRIGDVQKTRFQDER